MTTPENAMKLMKAGEELPVVTLERLRHHFREKYQLKEEQVDLMLQSSAQSLQHGLERLVTANDDQDFVSLYHGLKGLFLNMGEGEWADYIRAIEGRLKSREELDHLAIAKVLRRGVAEVLLLLQVK